MLGLQNAAKEPQAKSSGRTFTWKTAATVGALTLTGDTIGQTLERHKRAEAVKRGVLAKSVDGHDFIRSLRMFSYGFIFYGPFSHVWYSALDKMFPKGDLAAFAAKVFLNQVILGPIVVAVVFGWNFVLQGKAKELPAKYQADFVKTTVRGWTFWVPASMINFGLVPLHMRVIYMSTCAIVWNTYLSLVSMKA
eukprot:jgi/Mesvir1/8816/Mv02717-RA.1